MPRPEWLKCETCLFFDADASFETIFGDCHHGAPIVLSPKKGFCSNWTCTNCFGSYDAWASRDYDTDEEIYVDHSKCREVRFGI